MPSWNPRPVAFRDGGSSDGRGADMGSGRTKRRRPGGSPNLPKPPGRIGGRIGRRIGRRIGGRTMTRPPRDRRMSSSEGVQGRRIDSQTRVLTRTLHVLVPPLRSFIPSVTPHQGDLIFRRASRKTGISHATQPIFDPGRFGDAAGNPGGRVRVERETDARSSPT